MNFNKIILGGFAAFLLGSCSEEMVESNGVVSEKETTTYVKISLIGNDPTMTKADLSDFEDGTPEENAINRILLIFFDASRNYVGKSEVKIGENESNRLESTNDPDKTVERILTTVARVDLPENINYPKYVIAYVNPTSKADDLTKDKLEDVMCTIRQRATVSYEDYRTMNNSVYFNTSTGFSRFATEVDFNTQFFKSEADAVNATAQGSSIDIVVERVEAKVKLTNKLSSISQTDVQAQDQNGNPLYSLHFVPQAWFANGTEKRTFLIKNFRSDMKNYSVGEPGPNDNGVFDYGMGLSNLQAAFNVGGDTHRANEINDATKQRCYWAIDPTYFDMASTNEDLYPKVSYDVLYRPNENQTINEDGKYYPLEYRSYLNVLEEYNRGISTNYAKFSNIDGVTTKTHEYILENTQNRQTLIGPNAKAALTSVVLVGYYVVKQGNTVVFDSHDASKNSTDAFYIRHEASDQGNKYTMLLSDDEVIKFFAERTGSILYVKDNAGNYQPLRGGHLDNGFGVSKNDFRIIYPTSDLTGSDKKLSEQWRTVTLKVNANGVPNQNIYIFDFSTQTYRSINAEDMAKVNKDLYSAYGVVERFQHGKAYMSVPLKHIFGANITANEIDTDDVKLGDYGVVRNHVYRLTINKITGLGTGIGDQEQPIIPPTESDSYYINTRLRILQWRLVDQNVNL